MAIRLRAPAPPSDETKGLNLHAAGASLEDLGR